MSVDLSFFFCNDCPSEWTLIHFVFLKPLSLDNERVVDIEAMTLPFMLKDSMKYQ